MAAKKKKPYKKEVKYVLLQDLVIPAGSVFTDAGEKTFHETHVEHLVSLCSGMELATVILDKEAVECENKLFTTLKE